MILGRYGFKPCRKQFIHHVIPSVVVFSACGGRNGVEEPAVLGPIAGFSTTQDGPPADDLASLERSLTGVARELRTLVDRLRFESARREAILAGMAEGVLAVDPDLRVTFCNKAFLRAIGFRGENFERLSLLDPKAVLFIDDRQAQVGELNARFE